jgi:hypothetical protein
MRCARRAPRLKPVRGAPWLARCQLGTGKQAHPRHRRERCCRAGARGALSLLHQPPPAGQLRRHRANALSERRQGPRPGHQPSRQPSCAHNLDPCWLWLRYQPGSALAAWSRDRVGTLQGRGTRRIAIVAMARKLLIAQHGARDRLRHWWLVPPRFRWVASHRGNASCMSMRHYGVGSRRARPHVILASHTIRPLASTTHRLALSSDTSTPA